jgi:hypothetical protein
MGEWRYNSPLLDLGTRWPWVVSFTSLPRYPHGMSHRYPPDRRLGGPQCRSGLPFPCFIFLKLLELYYYGSRNVEEKKPAGSLLRNWKTRLTLEEILKEEGVRMWTGFNWLRVRSNGRLMWLRQSTFGFCKRWGTSMLWLAKWLSSSQVCLSFMYLD